MRDVDGESAPVTIGIVAGEASGDALAATLIHAVRSRRPWIRFAGIAGPKMEAAGCEAWASTEDLAVRGFAEVVAHLPASMHPTSTWDSSASSSAGAFVPCTS